MQTFIDESGKFTQQDTWSVVGSLTLPQKEVGPARRKISYLTREWPRFNGELKGGSLNAQHLCALVDTLFSRAALLHAAVVDMSVENTEDITIHKRGQCEGIVEFLTPEHNNSLTASLWDLHNKLDRMSPQLYVQCVLMRMLVSVVIQNSTMYFAQRRPNELSDHTWVIDAKDPRRVTTQEKWWVDTFGPLQESYHRKYPLKLIRSPLFDYSHFDRSYGFQVPPRARIGDPMFGYDIKKLVTDSISFTDSRSDILLQAIDILCSFLRRLLNGEITDPEVARNLGRLQILRMPLEGLYQNIDVLTFSTAAKRNRSKSSKMIYPMSIAGRPMCFSLKEERRV